MKSELGLHLRVAARRSPARAVRGGVCRAVFSNAWLWLACLLAASQLAVASATTPTPHNVLVIYSYGRMLPANIEGDRGVAAGFAERPDVPVSVSVEFLDNVRFSGAAYERTFVAYLREKYALQPPAVILVAADEAMSFVHRHRAELFPQVPIVHMGVTAGFVQSIAPLPPDVVGTPIIIDFRDTVAQALRLHRSTRRLVLVTGASAWDRDWESRLRALSAGLPRGLAVDFLAGLPVDRLERHLRQLPGDAIVFTPGFFRDGSGREFTPREAIQLIATVAPVPVYGPFSSFMGTGIVGGRMASYHAVGRQGAQTAIALLTGTAPASLTVPAVMPNPLQLDWRQLRRWGIAMQAVPADAIVHFRKPTLWESYRDQVLLGGAVMLLQAGLIVALLLERRRRRRTVAALARSEQHIRLAARAANLSTWVLDGDGIAATGPVRDWSPAGPAPGPLVDFRATLAQVSPHDRAVVDAALRDALATNSEFEVEYRVEAPDGEWRWQSARGRAEHAQAPRLLGVAIDITQRKRTEIQAAQDRAALYHMTRVSLLGQLSASIAHQLNQPLASIMGNAEAALKMLERDPLDVRELREICADIVAEDQRAAQVIRRLVVLFRRGEPLFEPLDLNDLVHDTLEITRSTLTTPNIALVIHLAPDLPPISGDRVQLQQLLLNLIVNASQAMAECPEDARDLTIETRGMEGSVSLCVTDRGPGVPADALDKVFEPFWSTRPGGMGMGLAVCRSIAEAHHGSLTVGNAPAGGAVFCVSLPALARP